MKWFGLGSMLLAMGLVVGAPDLGFAHVGHGDEFQAEGGIRRVPVQPATDPLLGIVVTPIAPAPDGSARILIPLTALVEASGQSLVFVQYENFYEPVPVTTGATQGEWVEVKTGLSVGEKLVTQGSLSLYAESRKTQTASPAQGNPQPQEANNPAPTAATPAQSVRFPVGGVAVVGGGATLAIGALALWGVKNKRHPSRR